MIARVRTFVARFHTCEFLARRHLLPGSLLDSQDQP
jgi:hypothetical protein